MQRTWKGGILAATMFAVTALAGCGVVATPLPPPEAIPQASPSPESLPATMTASPSPASSPTTAPTSTPSRGSGELTIWWPAPLAVDQDSTAGEMLARQRMEYESLRGVRITIRTKRADGPGGMFETLLSASRVAPAAVPDLVLVQHGELLRLVNNRLARPVNLISLPFDDLFEAGLVLGQAQGEQYGIPYALEIQHAVYRSAALSTPPRTLETLLRSGERYLFPARATRGVNPTFLAMYVAAGGRVADEDGSPVIDREPLVRVLSYFERAVASGTAGAALLEYATTMQYWSQFMTGQVNIVQIDSTTYLAQRAGGMPSTGPSAVAAAPLPMIGAAAPTIIDGWVWAVTATELGRQEQALDLLRWLMEASHQGTFLEALGILPSRRASLALWSDHEYVPFVEELLSRPPAPLPDILDLELGNALQDALEAVLTGRESAESAADDAVAQLAL